MKKIKQRFQELGLDEKFIFIILSFVLIPILIYTVIFFQYQYKVTIQENVSEVRNDVLKEKVSFQKVFELGNMTAQIFSENQELKQFLIKLKENDGISTEQYIQFYKKQMPVLEAFVNSNPYLYQVRVYAKNNQFPEMVPILYHEDRMRLFPWSEEKNLETWHLDYPDYMLSDEDQNHLMSIVRIVRDEFGQEVGVIEIAISMKENFFDLYAEEEGSFSCLVSKEQEIIAKKSSDFNWEEQTEWILSLTNDVTETQVISKEIGGEKVIVAVEPVEELGGSYLRIVSIEKEYQQILLSQIQIYGLILLTFFFVAFFIKVVVRSLLKQFYEILDVMCIVQKGNLNKRVEHISSDEMGEMGKQVNRMLDKIQILMKENIEREILVKNTEIKALQNQINVHFIYNVLESIKMMAEIDEKYEISDAITSLGELLRYNMKWVSGNVSIREEIAYIKNYIQLMNLRYDFTILLCINIEESIYEQKIPKMSLQPIVENAICHGIVGAAEDATIYIRSIRHGSDFEIAITDSGVGMSEEQKQLLERKIKGEADIHCGSGNGIGLKNVQDRIQMQFGDQYGLEFYSREGCFTKVRILLPIME